MTSQSQVERPDLDALFADLAHPNPHLQTQAYLAMVDHWPNESMPRLISLLDQPDVSLRRAAVRGLGAFGATALQPLAELFEASTDEATTQTISVQQLLLVRILRFQMSKSRRLFLPTAQAI